MKKKHLCGIVLALAGIGFCGIFSGCGEDKYPSKPVTLIVGFDPGTSADTTSRLLAQLAEPHFGQPINVVNKPGTSGAMSYQELHASKNDGYTIAMGTMTLISHSLMGTIKFSHADLTPIVNFQTDPSVLFVSARAPFKTWDEMIAYSKSNPGAVSCATSSVGGLTNIVARILQEKLDVEWKIVIGTGGGADGVTQAAGGHVDMAVGSPLEGLSFVESGDVVPLGVSSNNRLAGSYPDLPTFVELGCDLAIGNIRAFYGPPGVDSKRIDILRAAFDKAIKDEKFLANLDKTGAALLHLNSEETKKEFAKMTEEFLPILGGK